MTKTTNRVATLVSIALLMFTLGCVVEVEPNDTTAAAVGSGNVLTIVPGAEPIGAVGGIGTVGDPGVDVWIIDTTVTSNRQVGTAVFAERGGATVNVWSLNANLSLNQLLASVNVSCLPANGGCQGVAGPVWTATQGTRYALSVVNIGAPFNYVVGVGS